MFLSGYDRKVQRVMKAGLLHLAVQGYSQWSVSAPACVCVSARVCVCVCLCLDLSRSHHRGRSAVHLLLQLHHLLHVLGLEPVCLHGVISKAAH